MAGASQRRVGGTLERPYNRFDELQRKPLMKFDDESLRNRIRGLNESPEVEEVHREVQRKERENERLDDPKWKVRVRKK